MTRTFIDLGIREHLAQALKAQGIAEPTPIQEQAIPIVLSGRDVIAQAQTGTGKTLAFLLPALQRLKPEHKACQVLILSPTRELAIQIHDECRKLAPAAGARVLAVYGGQDVEAQVRKLKEPPHVVVATPGRLLDHMRRGTLGIGQIATLVLDEADQMLHMGFLPEVQSIIEQTPHRRQTLLFSATMPQAVRQLAAHYMREPADVTVRGKQVTLEGIKQIVVETTDRAKQQTLIDMIEEQRPYLAVVFCRTKIRAKKLTEALQTHGLDADELHGDLSQAKREQVMKRFRDAKLQILVATDVAARGLDVEGVTHIFNYDMPLDAESYLHRIGRTGRAGQTGVAITFASPRDRDKLALIERSIKMSIKRSKREAANNAEAARTDGAASKGRSGRGSESGKGAGGGPKGRSAGGAKASEGRRGRGSGQAREDRSAGGGGDKRQGRGSRTGGRRGRGRG